MRRLWIDLYKRLFVHAALFRFHRRLLNISLWGLGILNSENDRWSGEEYFLRNLARYFDVSQAFVVFDIGANVGAYASKLKTFYPHAVVYAFEPHPESFECLQRQAQQSGYHAFQLALSDRAGLAQLYNRAGAGSVHASLFREVIEAVHQDTATQSDVQVTTVDQFAQEHRIAHIHLLKIDAEGSEWNILHGASRLIEAGAIDVIQFEFNEMNVVSRVFFRDFYSLLPQYSFYRMLPDGLVPVAPQPAFLSEIFAFQNIVAARKSSQPA